MLNKIVNYYRRHRRDTKKYLRTNYTRPMKNILHIYRIQLIRQIGELKLSFFQLKNLRFVGIFVIIFWLFRDFAFATATEPTPPAQNAADSAVNLLNGLIFIIALIAQPLVMLIGWLLSPDWTFGDIIGLRPIIHSIWIIVSNIVYFIFAIMLIVIALMNIFRDDKSFALKSALPRLIVGILIVPFTWFIVSATLSVANVLTASVLSFSYNTILTSAPDISKNSIADKKIIPSKIYIDLLESESGSVSGTAGNSKTVSQKIDCDVNPKDCRSLKDILSGANGAYNLLTYYAYGIFRLDKLKDIGNEQVKNSIKNVGDIFKKLTFGTVFTLVFAILVIAIAFALFTRMAMMWLFAMFSPLFALSYFLGGKGPKGLEKIEKKLSIKTFISLAMVPVYVSAALSFGLIFLSFAMNGAKYTNSEYIRVNEGGKVNNNGEQSFSFGKKGQDVELIIKGNYAEKSSGIIGDTFEISDGIISNVIISFLALIILWMAVMAALGASEITEKAVKPIAEFGDSIGKLMVDAPKYIPIKLPGGKSISMAGVGAMGHAFSSSISNAATSVGSEYGSTFGKQAAEMLNLKMDDGLRKMQQHVTTTVMPKTQEGVGNDINTLLQLGGKSLEDFAGNSQTRKILADRILQIDNSIIGKNDKDAIVTNINKGTEKGIQEALQKVEQKVGVDNIGGLNNSFSTVEETRKTFENYKTTAGGKPADNPKIKPTKITVNKQDMILNNATVIKQGEAITLAPEDKVQFNKFLTGDEAVKIIQLKAALKPLGIEDDTLIKELLKEIEKK